MTTTRRSTWEQVRSKRPTSPQRVAAARDALEREITAHRLTELRKQARLNQNTVAKAMGVTQSRVSAIEHGDLDRTELSTVRAYVAALGGTVKIVADFGDHTTTLA